jgi:hypothetical protein
MVLSGGRSLARRYALRIAEVGIFLQRRRAASLAA